MAGQLEVNVVVDDVLPDDLIAERPERFKIGEERFARRFRHESFHRRLIHRAMGERGDENFMLGLFHMIAILFVGDIHRQVLAVFGPVFNLQAEGNGAVQLVEESGLVALCRQAQRLLVVDARVKALAGVVDFLAHFAALIRGQPGKKFLHNRILRC